MDVDAALIALDTFASSVRTAGDRVARIRAIRRFVINWKTGALGELSDTLAVYAIRNDVAFDKKRGPVFILMKAVMPKASKQRISEFCRAYHRLRPIKNTANYAIAVEAAHGFEKMLRAKPTKLLNVFKEEKLVPANAKWPKPGSL